MANKNAAAKEAEIETRKSRTVQKRTSQDSAVEITTTDVSLEEKKVKINVLVPETYHRKFKGLCGMDGLKLQNVALDLIKEWVDNKS